MSGSHPDRKSAERLLLLTYEAQDAIAKSNWTQATYLLEERGQVVQELIQQGFQPETLSIIDKSEVLAEELADQIRLRRSEIAAELKRLATAKRAIQSYQS